ncbi:catalase-peroxidase [Striga asiatica]|uniref:Catalase-peroxidase n=1 Tax=Striga asiatica TaxID=4170 RepID=A0A5A7Q4A7_STRAF|nr:catalase-peroxidase [Striga asiatica]
MSFNIEPPPVTCFLYGSSAVSGIRPDLETVFRSGGVWVSTVLVLCDHKMNKYLALAIAASFCLAMVGLKHVSDAHVDRTRVKEKGEAQKWAKNERAALAAQRAVGLVNLAAEKAQRALVEAAGKEGIETLVEMVKAVAEAIESAATEVKETKDLVGKGKDRTMCWWPTGRHDKLVSIDEQNLFLWSLDTSKKKKNCSGRLIQLSVPMPVSTMTQKKDSENPAKCHLVMQAEWMRNCPHKLAAVVSLLEDCRHPEGLPFPSSTKSSVLAEISQIAGTDSAVNLWLASLPSNELSDLLHLLTLCSSVAELSCFAFVQVLLGVLVNHGYLLIVL